MTPEFCLSLSFDGIVLLRREPSGELTTLAEVSVENPDLDREMKRLLRRLRNLSGGDAGVALVLPDSEIRYLTCPQPRQQGRAAQRAAIRAALDGRTPYAVDDLRFDWTISGDEMQVAAIALQTLEEAVSFARAHGFVPKALIAHPPPDRFAGVPDFGDGPRVERPAVVGTPGPVPAAEAQPLQAASDDTVAPGDVGAATERPAAEDAATAASGGTGAEPAACPEPERAVEQLTGTETAPGAPVPEPGARDTAPEPAASAPAPEQQAEPAAVAQGVVPAATADAETGSPAPLREESTGAEEPVPGQPASPAAAAGGGLRAMRLQPQSVAAGQDTQAAAHAPSSGLAGQRPLVGPVIAAALRVPPEAAAPAHGAAPEHDGGRPQSGPDAAQHKRERRGAAAATQGNGRKRGRPGAEKPQPDGPQPHVAAGVTDATGAPEEVLVPFASRRDAGGRGPGPVLAPPPPAVAADRKARFAVSPAPDPWPVGEQTKAPVATALAPAGRVPQADTLARSLDPREVTAATAGDEAERLTRFGARGQDAHILRQPRAWGRYAAAAAVLAAAIAALAWYFGAGAPERVALREADEAARESAAIPAPERLSLTEPEARPAPLSAAPEDAATAPAPGVPDALRPEAVAPLAPAPAGPGPDTPAPAPERALPAEAGDPAAVPGPVTATPPERMAELAPQGAPPAEEFADEIFVPLPDRGVAPLDPVSLPDYAAGPREERLPQPEAALPPGSQAKAGAGAPAAVPEETSTPAGAVVRTGPPPVVPPARPGGAAALPEAPAVENPLAGKRPRSRPEALAEDSERTALGGRTRAELADMAPRVRPDSEVPPPAEGTVTGPGRLASATALAPASVRSPRLRPAALAAVAPSRSSVPITPPAPASAPPAQVVSAPASAPAQVAAPTGPIIPSRASVARQATEEDVLPLNRMNLIGVYGAGGERRALVRLANGRYVKVEAGDELDGGRVAAIGERSLTYVKRGKSVQLDLPGGG